MNFGILGFGGHARKMLPSFLENPQIKSIAIGTTSSEYSLENFPAKVSMIASYEEVINHPEINAIYICLPNHLHYLWSKQSLLADKHVLCEKPICLKHKEAEDLKKLAATKGKFIAEAFMYRFHPQHTEVNNLINTGEIGEIRLIQAHYHYQLDNLNNIRLKGDCAGGALNDIGCYLIDLCLFLLEKSPEKIAVSTNFSSALGVDLSTSMQLNFPGNITAQLNCSMELPRTNDYIIYGTTGKISLPSAFRVLPNQKTSIEFQSKDNKTNIIKLPFFDQFAAQLSAFIFACYNPELKNPLFNNFANNAEILEKIRGSSSFA